MAGPKDYDDIPGTTVFDAQRSRAGYHLNMFCMSLMKEENRKAFKADEAGYLKRFPMTEEQRQKVLARDFNGMIALGGNIYYLAKLGATDGRSFQYLAAEMTGLTQEEYAQMMLGGGYDSDGMMRFGVAIQSIPARLAPVAVRRVLDHYLSNRLADESFREYVLRHKVETFRTMTNDLAKPAELFPEMYQDWGDEVGYSLQLGRGECAS